MEPKKYLIIFEDFSLEVVDKIDDDLEQSAIAGYVQVIDIAGAKDPKELSFWMNKQKWHSIKDNSKNSD